MALTLTRRKGERIMIGDDIVVTVTDIDRSTVRLDIDAPRDVRILREEVKLRIDAGEKREER
tara:strand:+ start:1095 stop:1280 length:186 start_codon:yes stop_codon:yes gene_type:complete